MEHDNADQEKIDLPGGSAEHADDGVSFPGANDARPREQKKNQPHYLGDKVDDAVERMEEGAPMSERATELLEQGKQEIEEAGSAE